MTDPSAGGAAGDGGPVGPLLDRKENGVAVLVTGSVPDTVHRSMSARLLGSPDADRRRVLALTHHEETATTERLPPGASTAPDRLQVVLGNGWTRSATAVDETGGAPAGSNGETVSDVSGGGDAPLGTVPAESVTALSDPSLASFGERVSRSVGALNRLAGEFTPGQLRLCLDSLDHLADGYGDSQVLRFAHLVADQVRSHDGMVHLHTRRPYDDLPVPGIDDVTEVVIRLRLTGEVPEFRPYLDDEPLTGWARIPPLPE